VKGGMMNPMMGMGGMVSGFAPYTNHQISLASRLPSVI
jgi:hypothetical protein